MMLTKSIFNDEPAQGWLPWGALAPVITLFFIVGLLIASDALVLRPLGLVDAESEPTSTYGLVAMLAFSFGLVGLLFCAWIKVVERRSFASVGLSAVGWKKTFLGGHGIGIFMVLATVGLIGAFGGYEVGSVAPAFSSSTALFQITLLLFGFAIQSSVEEFVFRGWLMSVLTKKFNLLAAVIISSALFSFMHFNPANPWYDNVNTLIFALFASAWVIKTGNVWGAMGWHAGWNWFTAVGFEVPITGLDTKTPALIVQLAPSGPNWLHGGTTGPEGSLICSAILLAGTLYWLWSAKTDRRAEPSTPA